MLNEILHHKQQELKYLHLPEQADVSYYSFYQALLKAYHPVGLIAEVKKASPSKGVIREDFSPVEIARAYESGGADALSVLTDQTYFQGRADYIRQIKQHVALPVLRKDFIIDAKQIQESVRIGADAILLIVGAVNILTLYELYTEAENLGLDCLVEVHTSADLNELLDVFTPKIIGVNNRDLTTFQTTVEHSAKLAVDMPNDVLFISESGISTSEDIRRAREIGAHAVLVGESLMKASSPEGAIRRLYGEVSYG